MLNFVTFLFSVFLTFTALYADLGSISCSDVTLTAESSAESREGITYDKYKITDETAKMRFDYRVPSNEDIIFEWEHNKEILNIPKGKTGHLWYELGPSEQRFLHLMFLKPSAKYSGAFKIKMISTATKDILVEKECNVFTPFPMLDSSYETIRETEGSPAEIACVSSSYPKPKRVQWTFWDGQKWIDSIPGAEFSAHEEISKALLKIQNLSSTHEGFYKCTVDGEDKLDSAIYVLRVRNPKAVYWPLIGIGLEVLILLITILVYEKKQFDKRKQDKLADMKLLTDETAQPLMQDSNNKNVRV